MTEPQASAGSGSRLRACEALQGRWPNSRAGLPSPSALDRPLAPGPAKAAGAGRPADLGRARLAGADLVRPGRDAGHHHAVHGAVRAARRHGEADAGQPDRAEPRRSRGRCRDDGLIYEFVLRKGVKFHNGEPVTAEDVKFSFERYRGAVAQGAQGPGGRGRDARSAAGPLQAQAAVARLPDVLRQRHRRRLDRAEEVRREGRRRGLQEGADRRRPLQVRLVHAGRRAGAGGVRRRTGARRPSVKRLVFKVDPRRVDAAGRAQARRGRHRLLDPRRARRGAASAPRGSRSSRPSSRRRSGSTSPTSGTRSRRGTTCACGWPPTSPSTARPSTRR